MEKGSVITNFKFEGFPNPDEDKSESVDIQLADFYNQSGDEVFPEGSPLGAGEPKPTVLLLNIGAVWCGPCQEEADTVLPGQYAKYSPKGVQFVFVLADGPNQGVPAGLNSLVSWTTKYETLWPATIDPSYTLGSLFKGAAFPVNIVIDTQTMKIVEAVAGLPEEDGPLFQALDELTE
ncbi:MAG: TlpA family protein disulfide reductase [Polyangiaceae bacterium]|nr:TlpA family protein disulfide reductase [Polyangiaceae bacterium]